MNKINIQTRKVSESILITNADLPKSAQFGNRQFPTRTNYEDYFLKKGIIDHPDELWNNEELVAQVQRHWHTSGQNGCVFAQQIARKPDEYGWESYVVNEPIENIRQEIVQQNITQRILQGIQAPGCEMLSLLFPQVTEEADLITLIRTLKDTPPIFAQDENEYGEFITLALRIDITGEGVLSWLLSFAPFSFYPKTRIAPVVELAIRTKPKPNEIFELLNQDREAAHLADVPLVGMDDHTAHSVWKATLKNTRDILGEEPDELSAAKSTFVLPKSLWVPVRT